MGISNAYIAVGGQIDSSLAPFRKIATTTLTGAAASVSFTGIASGYKRFKIIHETTPTGAGGSVYLRFNNDSGANQYKMYILSGVGGAAAAAGFSDTKFAAGLNIFTPTVKNIGEVLIDNQAALVKNIIATGGSYEGCELNCGYWNNAADEINRIDLVISNNNFAIGSRFTIYGLVE